RSAADGGDGLGGDARRRPVLTRNAPRAAAARSRSPRAGGRAPTPTRPVGAEREPEDEDDRPAADRPGDTGAAAPVRPAGGGSRTHSGHARRGVAVPIRRPPRRIRRRAIHARLPPARDRAGPARRGVPRA